MLQQYSDGAAARAGELIRATAAHPLLSWLLKWTVVSRSAKVIGTREAAAEEEVKEKEIGDQPVWKVRKSDKSVLFSCPPEIQKNRIYSHKVPTRERISFIYLFIHGLKEKKTPLQDDVRKRKSMIYLHVI